MRTVTLENVGPIARLVIPLPQSGVVVLRGRNGVGKSHALAAVDSLLSGRGRPPCRDGAVRGVVEGVGVRLTIGRSARRTGEAEVATLEGRLDISQLVSPPIKDDESADRVRIKALIQLSGASIDPSVFESILPDGLDLGDLVTASDLQDDPVVLAGKIKRALEAEARRYEKEFENHSLKAAALREQVPVDYVAGSGPRRDETESELQAALVRLKELQTRAEEAGKQRERVLQARERLEKLRTEAIPGDSVSELEGQLQEIEEKIEQLERALAVAEERRRQLRRRYERARLLESQIRELEAVISQSVESPDETELAAAEAAVAEARSRHALAIEAERARQLSEQARVHAESAERARDVAEGLRRGARATDDVLTGLVSQVTRLLRVEAGRLVCDTDRGVEPFSELSPGERWRIALQIAVEQVGTGGLVTVPQEAWEGLDPQNRAEIARIAHEVGVVILTAEADSQDEIQAEVI